MKNYPKELKNQNDVFNLLNYIVKERINDVKDFDNLKNIFMRGRKVNKVPTSSTDIEVKDNLGDFNYDASYLYILVDNGGSNEWRRAPLQTW